MLMNFSIDQGLILIREVFNSLSAPFLTESNELEVLSFEIQDASAETMTPACEARNGGTSGMTPAIFEMISNRRTSTSVEFSDKVFSVAKIALQNETSAPLSPPDFTSVSADNTCWIGLSAVTFNTLCALKFNVFAALLSLMVCMICREVPNESEILATTVILSTFGKNIFLVEDEELADASSVEAALFSENSKQIGRSSSDHPDMVI